MSSEPTDETSMPDPDERHTVGDCRSGFKLLCPVRAACPHLHPETKTCDNHCNDIRRVKEHVNKRHQCTCTSQQEPCQNPLHIDSEKLEEMKTCRHVSGETPGEQWGRIFKILYPGRNDIPAPYELSASDLKVIVRAPPRGFFERLAESLRNETQGSIHEGDILLVVSHFIDLVCETGAYPDSQSSAPHSSNNDGVSAAHTSRQGAVAEHQEPANDDLDMGMYLHLGNLT